MAGDKKQQIYEGVIALLDGGMPLMDLTVSKIAVQAGIGKGTIYEYFESKDEVIARAIYYKLSLECKVMESLLSNNMSFREKCYLIFDAVTGNSLSAFPMVYKDIEVRELLPLLRQIPEEFSQNRKIIREALERLLQQGAREGAIAPVADIDFASYTFVCALSGLHTLGKDTRESLLQKNKDMSYRLLLSAFGGQ